MRRRFIIEAGELVEVTGSPAPALRADSGALWGDSSYRDLRATDGTPIDTRTKHREYMKQHGLTTIDDYTQHFAKAERERDAHRTYAPDPQRKLDIARAMEKLRG
jgi:hypothetical protein